MADTSDPREPAELLGSLGASANAYFDKAEAALTHVSRANRFFMPSAKARRDYYWAELPQDLRDEARKLSKALVSTARTISSTIKNSSLVSEADERDVLTSIKVMRAALLLREFRSWSAEVLHDEGRVLGVHPAGQDDDFAHSPEDARISFSESNEKVRAILDLAYASPGFAPASQVSGTTSARIRPNTAFIMMSMDKARPELVDVLDTIKKAFARFDISAVRADDIEHEDLITQKILNEIATAEFLFADLSDGRPNVYYEVGYAHALTRRVILFRRAGTGLHFDLAAHNCPEYANMKDLREKLTRRLEHLTNKKPKDRIDGD